MRLRRSRILPAAAALTLLAGCAGTNAVDQSAGSQFRFVSGASLGTTYPAAQRRPAGQFSAALLGGGSYRLAQDAGKVVVLNFWATWCGPCTTETPQFDSVYRANHGRPVDFVGVDTKDNPGSAEAFVADNHISYPIAVDEQGETALRLGKIPALGLPFTVLVDKRQRVAAVYLSRLAPKDLQPVLTTLLAEA